MRSARPWRGVAFLPFPGGRITVARTSRATRASLDAWAEEERAAGRSVDLWEVRPIPEVAAQVAAGLPG
jgi:hypothetical protein